MVLQIINVTQKKKNLLPYPSDKQDTEIIIYNGLPSEVCILLSMSNFLFRTVT